MTTLKMDLVEFRHKVIFRKFNRGDFKGDIIAFLPEIEENPGYVMSYEHIGQHGSADYYGLLSSTVLATPEEYTELKTELESIGYILEVKQKLNPDWLDWIQ